MKASLIFNVCGLFSAILAQNGQPPPTNGADLALSVDEPLSMLHGEYQVDKASMLQYRPTWASLWSIEKDKDVINGHFHISLWPPKYCHAVYVCPYKTQTFSALVNFKTDEAEICEKEYVKFYPHAKKLLVKDEGKAVEKKYWVKNRLQFDIDENFQATVHAYKDEPEKYDQLMDDSFKDSGVQINLAGKDLLILTNSRMCQVNKIGSDFQPLFKYGIQSQQSGDIYPKWIYENREAKKSDYLPPVKSTKAGKQVDLLSYLKEKQWTGVKLGNSQKGCQPVVGWKAAGRARTSAGTFKYPSVNSYHVNVHNAQAAGHSIRTFTLRVESCHWFRLWFSESGLMNAYNSEMKLSETVDFFLNEGFYVSPESDIAIALPGVNELNRFTFSYPHYDDADNYVDMTFGEYQGRVIYHDQFKVKPTTATSFNLHIIKAPGCEILMESRSAHWVDYETGVPFNHWKFGTCEFSHFK